MTRETLTAYNDILNSFSRNTESIEEQCEILLSCMEYQIECNTPGNKIYLFQEMINSFWEMYEKAKKGTDK